jgi:DnaJ-class molecular chaperone
MTRQEALQVLGLEDGAGKDEIKAAYHRLMAGLHPDHGGSTYLATKLNQARDILLGDD